MGRTLEVNTSLNVGLRSDHSGTRNVIPRLKRYSVSGVRVLDESESECLKKEREINQNVINCDDFSEVCIH